CPDQAAAQAMLHQLLFARQLCSSVSPLQDMQQVLFIRFTRGSNKADVLERLTRQFRQILAEDSDAAQAARGSAGFKKRVERSLNFFTGGADISVGAVTESPRKFLKFFGNHRDVVADHFRKQDRVDTAVVNVIQATYRVSKGMN